MNFHFSHTIYINHHFKEIYEYEHIETYLHGTTCTCKKKKKKKTFKYTRFAGTVVKTSKYKIVQVTSSTSC